MNRPIKFRAWNKKTKVMVDLNKITPMALDIDPTTQGAGWGVYVPDHVDMVVMQFTGLHDKNGKEIYEGDLVKYRVGGAAASEHIGTVQWFSYYWGVEKEFGFGLLQDVAIIGNIHEHPDLLK